MTNIQLRQSLDGRGFSGHVAPALSWEDHLNLRQAADGAMDTARAAMASAVELRYVNEGLRGLADVVIALESELGLRLESQTRILDAQVEVLERIEQALRKPGQVSAAERIANTGELLRRGRYARALAEGELAIKEDPNNAAGFMAAGWAAVGLGDGARARELFEEAAEAADSDARETALRQAARIAFALEDGQAALQILERCDQRAAPVQRCAAQYDRAVYLAASSEPERAKQLLKKVLAADDRFGPVVLTDAILGRDERFRDLAIDVIKRLTIAIERTSKEVENELRAADVRLASHAGPLSARARERRARLRASISEARKALQQSPQSMSLGAHLDSLKTLKHRATALVGAVGTFIAQADDEYRKEQMAKPRRAEAAQNQGLDPAAGAKLAKELETSARKFARNRGATVEKRADGSWLIYKKKLLGDQAWHAQLANGSVSIEVIPSRRWLD